MPARRVGVLGALAICFFICPTRAVAHPAPFSFLDLVIRDAAVDGILVVHVEDVAHELGVQPPDRLLNPAELQQIRVRLIALLAPRLGVSTDGAGAIEWGSVEPAEDRHAVLIRFRIPGARAGALYLAPRMFPYDPGHQTFVNIYEDDRIRQQLIFSATSGGQTYYSGSTQGVLAVMRTFVPAGIHHILIGPDHILFLVGLLLLGGTWMALVRIVTAFTIGHSVTLSLAALNLVMPPARIIEPAIALSIIFVGADNLVRGTGRDVRAWAALVFGLVHGFGFANVLREFGLPAQALGWSLFSFNLGVEIGQLGIVLLVATVLAFIRRQSPGAAHRVVVAGSVLVIVAGVYWFVERVFFPEGLV